ncbi:MAG: hypothetical protein WC755_01455 [Candidatus Woesearchaeota archaeon]|jgi:hypothetical protein
MTNHFYDKYLPLKLKEELKELDIESKLKDHKISLSEVDQYKEEIFAFLSSKNLKEIYFDLLYGSGSEISFLICNMTSKEECDKIKEKIISYYGIYQKTKHISSIYLFDNDVFIELSAGDLDGDDLILKIANILSETLKLERHDYICEIELDEISEDINDLID